MISFRDLFSLEFQNLPEIFGLEIEQEYFEDFLPYCAKGIKLIKLLGCLDSNHLRI